MASLAEIDIYAEKLAEIRRKILEEMDFFGSTLEEYEHTQETFEMLTLEELETMYKGMLPTKSPRLRYDYNSPVDASASVVSFVNNNEQQEILLVNGEYIQWYYGRNSEGQFYEKRVTGHSLHIYILDGPLDPKTVCSN